MRGMLPYQSRPAYRNGWRWVALDTEFVEHPAQPGIPPTVDLVSVGVVDVDTGDSYYAVVDDPDLETLLDRPFLRDHVAPHLPWRPAAPGDGPHLTPERFDRTHNDVRSRTEIAGELVEFLSIRPKLRIWANCGGYDYIVVQWLLGGIVGKPGHLPWHFDEVQTWLWANDLTADDPDYPNPPSDAHHALADAVHTARVLRWVDTVRDDRHAPTFALGGEPGS